MDPTPQEAAALAAKKKTKGQKMTLAEFNAGPSSRTTSWADEMDSFKPTLPGGPTAAVSLPTGPGSAAGTRALGAGGKYPYPGLCTGCLTPERFTPHSLDAPAAR